jgi:hypothetical protein
MPDGSEDTGRQCRMPRGMPTENVGMLAHNLHKLMVDQVNTYKNSWIDREQLEETDNNRSQRRDRLIALNGVWLLLYLPEIVASDTATHGSTEKPELTRSFETADTFMSISAKLPDTIDSLMGYLISPSSMR